MHRRPERPGLETAAEGFRPLGFKDDHARNVAEWIVYDAPHAYGREMIKRGKPQNWRNSNGASQFVFTPEAINRLFEKERRAVAATLVNTKYERPIHPECCSL